MIPKIKLYLNTEGTDGVFGNGKWQLLCAIKKHGSIQSAAKSLGRSYRKAWGDIKLAESGFGRKIVITNRGGVTGGKSDLTDFGLQLLEKWEEYSSEVKIAMDRAYKAHLLWINDKKDLVTSGNQIKNCGCV